MDQLKVKTVKNTREGKVYTYKKLSANESKDISGTIAKLRADKKDFKVVENNVEKTFVFNGNNYVVSSKILK